MISEGRNHAPAANRNLHYITLQSNNQTNDQIIKTNNELFRITVLRIRPRLRDVGSNPVWEFHNYSYVLLISEEK